MSVLPIVAIFSKRISDEGEVLTFGEWLADQVSEYIGSWRFISHFAATIIVWVTVNSTQLLWHPFDRYPYILLNLFLSLLASVQAPIIMISNKRQDQKAARRQAEDLSTDTDTNARLRRLEEREQKLYAMVEDLHAKQFPKLPG